VSETGQFYVSVIDGARKGLLLGPFGDHDRAKARVDEVRRAAREVDPRASFYAYGTARWKGDPAEAPQGRLNERLGL
jgi:hypothetical protein